MVVNKTKKVQKYRAKTTHGGGHRKKRRGAGSRGGRGNAGTGKKAGHKVAGSIRKLGSRGFTSKTKKGATVGLNNFTIKKVEKLVTDGKANKEGDTYSINLNSLGYKKLIATGNVNLKLKITAKQFSAKAEEKVKAAGGEIVLDEQKNQKQSKPETVEEKQ
jgi:large subunit ribosomal protein L15